MNKNRNSGFFISLIIIGFMALVGIFFFNRSGILNSGSKYYEILSLYQTDKIKKSRLELSSGNLEYYLKSDPSTRYSYKVPSVKMFVEAVDKIVCENQGKDLSKASKIIDYVRGQDYSWLFSTAPSLVGLIIMILLFFFMLKFPGSGAGRFNQFGKSGLKNGGKKSKKTTFKDVAGADEEKEELEEIVEFLKNPKKFIDMGARIPKGVLLVGPPGTGKTLLAKAIAGEANVPFFSISGSDFVEMYVGVGASRVRDLFEKAKKESPAIIFIDEIDAVGRQRGAGIGGGHDEREQTLNQLLVEMDGFGENEGIIIIAATNRRDVLDPALIRPGRFDREIFVSYPDVKGREEILKVHSKNKVLGFDVNLKMIARMTVGFSGADLENLLNEAALLAVRKQHKVITSVDIKEATTKVVMGPEKKSRMVIKSERILTAYHEAGHAVASYFCKYQDKVIEVSIIPRGAAGGYTFSLPETDQTSVRKKKMEEYIVVSLGGRVCESLIFDDISTGAAQDIKQATKIARSMVTEYGFSKNMGPIRYGPAGQEVFLGRDFANERGFSEDVAKQIDKEVKDIIFSAYETCEKILKENLEFVRVVAEYLLKREKIDEKEFKDIMTGKIDMQYVENLDVCDIEKEETKEKEEKANVDSNEKQANLQQNKKDALMEKIKEKLDEEKDWEKKNNKDDEEKNKSE